jgi:hypothetical protein
MLDIFRADFIINLLLGIKVVISCSYGPTHIKIKVFSRSVEIISLIQTKF